MVVVVIDVAVVVWVVLVIVVGLCCACFVASMVARIGCLVLFAWGLNDHAENLSSRGSYTLLHMLREAPRSTSVKHGEGYRSVEKS